MKIEEIARICHNANKTLCEINGDYSQMEWYSAEEWQRESAIEGVEFAKNNPDAPDSSQHDAWCDFKTGEGWVYGEVKDAVAKTHPCLVPFEDLPKFQQDKDTLFKAICKALL